jgi:hypothetical protein
MPAAVSALLQEPKSSLARFRNADPDSTGRISRYVNGSRARLRWRRRDPAFGEAAPKASASRVAWQTPPSQTHWVAGMVHCPLHPRNPTRSGAIESAIGTKSAMLVRYPLPPRFQAVTIFIKELRFPDPGERSKEQFNAKRSNP